MPVLEYRNAPRPARRPPSRSDQERRTDAALRSLTLEEERLLRMRYGVGERSRRLEEVSSRLAMTLAQAFAIEQRALRKLRANSVQPFAER